MIGYGRNERKWKEGSQDLGKQVKYIWIYTDARLPKLIISRVILLVNGNAETEIMDLLKLLLAFFVEVQIISTLASVINYRVLSEYTDQPYLQSTSKLSRDAYV